MVNEATLMYETSPPIPMTCAEGTGIEKGALLTLSDPMTAALVSVSQAATAGIAAEEKIASDGKTKIAVYREGIFKVTASGAVTVGDACMFSLSNTVEVTEVDGEQVAGLALETATNAETLLFELKPMHYNLA